MKHTAFQAAINCGDVDCLKLDKEAHVHANPGILDGPTTALQLSAAKGALGLAKWLI